MAIARGATDGTENGERGFQVRHEMMMKMKNHWKRFCGQPIVCLVMGSALTLGMSAMGWSQQGNQVAPPAAGYGNRPTAGTPNQPANTSQPRPGQPTRPTQSGQQQQPATPVQGNAAQPNPNFNPGTTGQGAIPGFNANALASREVVTKDPYAENPLTPQETQHLDQILQYWEKSTANIERYACKFKRWQYNSSDNFVAQLAQQLNRDIRTVHTTAASGEVKYMNPDKGMIKVDMLLSLTGQLDAKGQAEYKEFGNRFGEWWLCDGKSVYEYDRSKSRCTIHELPSGMQGEAILDSPMPFVFGIKADKLKERYWVRALAPPKNQQGVVRDDIFVIEVHPKFQSDAVNYHHVQIYLDRAEFLPIMLIRYNTEHVDEPGAALVDNREVYEFFEREKNSSIIKKMGELFGKSFLPLDIPKDWQVERIPYAPPAMSPPVNPAMLGNGQGIPAGNNGKPVNNIQPAGNSQPLSNNVPNGATQGFPKNANSNSNPGNSQPLRK